MLKGYFDYPTFTFFSEGNIWSGSLYKTFNFRIMPSKKKIGDENEVKEFKVYIWYGLNSFDVVKDFVSEYSFDFTEEILENDIRAKLTEEFEKFKEIRKTL